MKYIILSNLFVSSMAYSGGGVTPQNWPEFFQSLIAPATNVGIILFVLIWKLKGPASEMFKKKAKDTAEALERIENKSKEVKMMLDAQKEKKKHLDSEVDAILSSTKSDLDNFEQKYKNETIDRIAKLKDDAQIIVEAEKQTQLESINEELINHVIRKSKETLKEDNKLSEVATNKILEGIK